MASPRDRVTVTVEDDLAIVTLTRGDRHNGMDFHMLDAVVGAQKQVRRMRDVRAVILRGEGPSFCAGLDFKSVTKTPWRTAGKMTQLLWPFRNQFQQWSLGWRDLGVPVIAVIHGACYGAGIQLALGADVRFCTPDAKLSVMEAKWGLIPDMGGAVLLKELIPVDVAKELTMTGRVVSGEQAHALGLVTHLSTEPEADARSLAAEIATRSPDSVAAGKMLMQDAYGADHGRVASAERRWQRKLIGFANFRASVQRNGGKPDTPYVRRSVGR